jgi:predicted HTH domain antitoxin
MESVVGKREVERHIERMRVVIDVPDMTDEEFRDDPEAQKRGMVEIACQLYQKQLLSFAHARRLANLDLITFGHELMSRNIPRHYTEKMLMDDIAYAQAYAGH